MNSVLTFVLWYCIWPYFVYCNQRLLWGFKKDKGQLLGDYIPVYSNALVNTLNRSGYAACVD